MINKSKKPLVIISLLVLIALISISVIFYARETKEKELKVDNISTEKTKINDGEQKIIEEETKDIGNEEILNNTSMSEDKINKTEQSNDTSTIKENVEQNNNSSNIPSNNEKKENTPVINEKPVVKETPKQEVKETPIWETYGMSEYDYYNKPMWSWARVDFSVNDYGNETAAHQACIDAGHLKSENEDIISFSCVGINSTSGNYLGEMLKVKQ